VARFEPSGLKHRAERCLAGGMGRQNQLAPFVARAPQDEQNQFHVRFAAEILQKLSEIAVNMNARNAKTQGRRARTADGTLMVTQTQHARVSS
jgi:hypothetical protein